MRVLHPLSVLAVPPYLFRTNGHLPTILNDNVLLEDRKDVLRPFEYKMDFPRVTFRMALSVGMT